MASGEHCRANGCWPQRGWGGPSDSGEVSPWSGTPSSAACCTWCLTVSGVGHDGGAAELNGIRYEKIRLQRELNSAAGYKSYCEDVLAAAKSEPPLQKIDKELVEKARRRRPRKMKITQKVINSTMKRNHNKIMKCFHKTLQSEPDLSGKIVYSFIIIFQIII